MPPYEGASGDGLEGSVDESVRSSDRSGESYVSRADSEEIARMHEWDHMFMEHSTDSEDEEVAHQEYDTEYGEEGEYSESSPVEEYDACDEQY